MTGSALARYELRGTFHMRVLAALRPPRGRVREGDRDGIDPQFGPSADFFLCVSIEDFHQKWSLKASKLRSMLDLVLGGSWRPLGAVLGGSLGGQDAPKTAQDGAKMAQDGAKTAPRRPKMAPRRS